MSTALDVALARLPAMATADLRQAWERLTGGPVPRVSPSLLRLALAWEIQARAQGGLARPTRATLDHLAAGKATASAAVPGLRLVRAWNGTAHVVIVGEDGIIRWNNRQWRSLSEVARAITGTRWSGPAFFGLKRSRAA